MASQAPIKVNETTKDRIRYLAAVSNLTQAQVVDVAVREFALRHSDMIEKGLDHARTVLAGGDDESLAAYLLDMPRERGKRVSGTKL